MATVRQPKQPSEMIHVVDISAVGCGFRSRWPFFAGARVWLGLPGLEAWPATVVWFEEGKGGMRFERPLNPIVAGSFAAEVGLGRPLSAVSIELNPHPSPRRDWSISVGIIGRAG